MNTYLGAAQDLSPSDIDEAQVAASRIVYLEGYLWDPKNAKEAFVKAATIAHRAGRQVALTLSDSFCVDRYRDEFLDLMRSGTVDIVFANRAEALALYETDDFEHALSMIAKDCKLAAVTLSEEGSIIVRGNERVTVEATTVSRVVDTTGAGDLYAAGFLHGYTTGRTLADCGKLGSLAAGIVIEQVGPRPMISLKTAATEAGLL